MRVLALTHRVPFPPDKGDKIRTFNLLSRLATRCEVHLAALAEPPSDVAHAARLRRVFASVTLAPLDLRVQRVRALPALLSSTPLTVPVFHSARLEAEVDALVRELRPDVIYAESSSMAPYALRHPRVPLVMDFVDADSAKWSAYAERAGFPMRFVHRREARTLAAFERHVAGRAAISVVTAERERELFAAIAPGCDVRALPNGVDTAYFAPAAHPAADASAVFFGAMDYQANVEAAEFLVRAVLPKVRVEHPSFRVVLAGSNPAAAVRVLADVPGVTVTGFLPDLRDVVRGCAVCAIPLRVARGVQNKVLEAMAMGVPVVCSPGAAEGVDAEPGVHLAVASVSDDGTATAEVIATLLRDRARAAALAAAARERVVASHGWEPRAAQLHELLAEAVRGPASALA